MSDREAVAIRRATPNDTKGILRCLRTAFEPYRPDYTPEGFLDTVLTPTTVGERLRAMTVFVAITASGPVIGTVACSVRDAGEGHVRGMAVLPEWQGAGVAPRLLEAAESELRARSCTRATLDATEPLHRAARFYEKQGYRLSGKVGDFFGMRLLEYVKRL